MTMQAKTALDALAQQGLAEFDLDARWAPADFARFKEETKLTIPSEMAFVLETYGMVFFEALPFSVTFKSGSVFETEVTNFGGPAAELVKDTQRYLDVYNTVTGALFEPARAPEGYVHVGKAEGNRSRVLMDGVNADNNAVYLWGIAYDPWGEGDNTMGLGQVADSLFDWIGKLGPAR